MFKSRYFISVILTLLVGVSLVMTYFLLYDLEGFQQIIGVPEETVNAPIENGQLIEPAQSYYQTTNVRFQDVIAPDELLVRLGQQSYRIHDESSFNTIRSLVESRPFTIDNAVIVEDASMYDYLFDVDHLQIVMPERLPIGLYTRMLSLDPDIPNDVYFDRIIIPLVSQEDTEIYLVDIVNESYVVGQLSVNLSTEELRNAVSRSDNNMIEVMRYQGFEGPIYLPIHNVELDSQLFTLETISENQYIMDIFSDGNYTPSEVREGLTRYQNYQYTLEVNDDQQRFTLGINRIGQGEPRTLNEKIRNSYSFVQDYEYWDGDLRLTDFTNNFVTYRRYHDGFPILTKSTLPDYGANIVQMRNDISGDVYRYQQPMLVFYAYINHISDTIELASHDEIIGILEDNNYTISAFQNVFVGFEWQEDMENFRKAELIPTWFFELNGTYYTLEEIQSDAFGDIWASYQNYLSNRNITNGGDD